MEQKTRKKKEWNLPEKGLGYLYMRKRNKSWNFQPAHCFHQLICDTEGKLVIAPRWDAIGRGGF